MPVSTVKKILKAVPAVAALCAECDGDPGPGAGRCAECGRPLCPACLDAATADGLTVPVCLSCDLAAIQAAGDDERAGAAAAIERANFVGQLLGVA